MTLNLCQRGHLTHESRLVPTDGYGDIYIWTWENYMDYPNYCTGQDEVSKSIDLQGVWERADSDLFCKILEEKPGLVLDLGSHIGWFSALAADRDCTVWAFDADPENVRLYGKNMEGRSISGQLWRVETMWVKDIPRWRSNEIRLMKVDIEGHEHEALNLTRHLWQERRIDYGLWELSPIFEKRPGIMAESYAALVDEIASYGYRWFILKDEGQWEITGADLTFPQENAWAERI